MLIEKGVLRGYLFDKLSSRLLRSQTTGSGRRESYQHIPMPRMTNTFMLAGDSDPEDIIRSTSRGLYCANFGGGQVDITSGNFVFNASESYLIEDGHITRPVRGAMLTGNGPEALKHVSMVGHDLKLDEGMGMCGKEGQSVPVGVGIPTIKIDRMTVGGTRRHDRAGAGPPDRPTGHGTRRYRRRMHPRRRRRILGASAHARTGDAGRLRLAEGWAARVAWPARRIGPYFRSFLRRRAPDGGIGAGHRGHLHRRPFRRYPGPFRAGVARWQSRALLRRHPEHRYALRAFKPRSKPKQAALSWDPRITNSEGASFSAYSGRRVFANSRGFLGSYRTSSCSLSATPVARQGDAMERDFWYSSARSHSKLDSSGRSGTARRGTNGAALGRP